MLPVAEHDGFFITMPASTREALGAKLVSFYPGNQGIPTHHALILLFHPQTGEPLVIMDGRLITEIRTAAVSAVATQRLARAEASVLAIGTDVAEMKPVTDDVRRWKLMGIGALGVTGIAAMALGVSFAEAIRPSTASCGVLSANALHRKKEALPLDNPVPWKDKLLLCRTRPRSPPATYPWRPRR